MVRSRRVRGLALLASVAVCAAQSQTASAAEPLSTQPPNLDGDGAGKRWQKKLAVHGQVGLATPLGGLGLSLEYAPIEELSVAAGVGLGSGPYCASPEDQPAEYDDICGRWHRDLQYAVLARARMLVDGPFAMGLGAGPSMGGYTWVEPLKFDEQVYKTTERAYWANVEYYLEARSEAGWTGRLFVGYAFMLNASDLSCVGWGAGDTSAGRCADEHAEDGHGLLYLGLSGGFAL